MQIVFFATPCLYNPSDFATLSHLPLHRGGFGSAECGMGNLRFFADAQNDNTYASDNPYVSDNHSVTASRATSPYTGEAWGVHTFCPPCVKEGGTL